MNSQTLFTNLLSAACEARGLVLITDLDYSNTGTFRIAPTGSLAFIAEINFSFQSGYATFRSTNRLDLCYVVPAKYTEALDAIVALLPAKRKIRK